MPIPQPAGLAFVVIIIFNNRMDDLRIVQVERMSELPEPAAVLDLVAEIQHAPPYSYRPGEVRAAHEWFPELVATAELVFVAYGTGKPVGFCVALPISAYGNLDGLGDRLGVDLATTAYLAELGVAASVRRHGVASLLLRHMHDALTPDTTDVVVRTIAGNEPAIAFYQRHGYQVVDSVTQQLNGRPRIFLTRRR
jgi:ribosomal protein S18 acetylase RimI-like enzyme